MATIRIEDKLVEILKDKGCEEVNSPSSKYRKFTCPTAGPDPRFYWVGKLGALRFGKTVTSSTSRARLVPTLLKAWDAKHAQDSK